MVFSRWETCLLAMGMEMSRRSAARVKLPLCTTWQKTFMLSRVSMVGLSVGVGDFRLPFGMGLWHGYKAA